MERKEAQINFRVTPSMREELRKKAAEKGLSIGQFLIEISHEICQKKHDKLARFSGEKDHQTRLINVRLRRDQFEKIDAQVRDKKISRSELVRELISKSLGLQRAPTNDEKQAIREAALAVNRIGNNLNQIARKINSGESGDAVRITPGYLNQIIDHVQTVEQKILGALRQ